MNERIIHTEIKALASGSKVITLPDDIKSGVVDINQAAKILLDAYLDRCDLCNLLLEDRRLTEKEQALMNLIADYEAAIASLNRERKLEHFFNVNDLTSKLYQAKFDLLDELLKRFE